ncbi:MAG: helix-turn-helix domain-containing protein [Acidobacteriota bacterium]
MPRLAKNSSVAHMVEDIVGCKWSLQVLGLVRKGIYRPGAMVRSADGLTTKVLNERLKKMTTWGILEKIIYPEIPPHVEYKLTGFGKKFIKLLDDIDKLQSELTSPD